MPRTAFNRLVHAPQYCLTAMMLTLGGEVVAVEQRTSAAEGTATEDEQPSSEDGNRTVLGFGVAVIPRYQGSDEYRERLVPLLDVKRWRFFAQSGQGIGFNLIETRRVEAGVAVDWMQGYDDGTDVPTGVGDLDDELGGKIFVKTRLGRVMATLSSTKALSEDERGLLINVSLSYPHEMTDRLTVVPSISATWADDDYMNSYFGVNTTQSANAGLPVYRPSSGFKDVEVGVAANYQLDECWSLVGALGTSRLLGDASDSPLVESDSQLNAVMGFSYAF